MYFVSLPAQVVNAKNIIDDGKNIMITGDQIRAARGLLRWSAKDLAVSAGISLPTVQRMEAVSGLPSSLGATLISVKAALEAAGVEFIPENGGGAGVRFRDRRG